ncbi:hypothetical protein BDA96_06G113500 [Sorghum bicolor]|uniref:Uncharacterized protein n=2 Tax=Sorghum bicolor TaxID=4558 RepID=A0A921QSX7_SORBI|nr:hypothetical protein BDA96_06G113500 [Sorghum bicolor]KXG26396.2 hypothetical protein SORBI_3006G102650 [Sorghum bicolor]
MIWRWMETRVWRHQAAAAAALDTGSIRCTRSPSRPAASADEATTRTSIFSRCTASFEPMNLVCMHHYGS